MKKRILLSAVFAVFFSISSINSQILLDENFNYPAGDSLTAHGWTWINSYVNTILVATGSLTYSGYGNSGIGNNVRMHNTGQDVYTQFTPATDGNIYVAFLINVDSVQAAGDYFHAFLPSTSTTNYTMRTFLKSSGAGFQIGISKSTEAATYSSQTYNLGTTYLIIAKYTFNTGTSTDDELSLFVFSGAIPGTEPSPTVGPITGPQTDSPDIGRVALRQGTASNAATLNIDGFRVFKTWVNIVGVKPISTIAEGFALSQNYPNPFNPVTNIKFSVPERGLVNLTVYDLLGREVTRLVDGHYSLGTYEVDFNANGLGSGIYLYRLNVATETGKEFTDSKKLMLVK